MKKLTLVAALVLAGTGLAWARAVNAPTTNGYPARAEYGGVSIATSNFDATMTTVSVSFSTAPASIRGDRTVWGVNFSTGNCGALDWVDVWDSSTALNAHMLAKSPTLRLYNVNGSTATTNTNAAACTGFSGLPVPVRFTRGLFFKPSNNDYNAIQLLYHKND